MDLLTSHGMLDTRTQIIPYSDSPIPIPRINRPIISMAVFCAAASSIAPRANMKLAIRVDGFRPSLSFTCPPTIANIAAEATRMIEVC